MTRTLLAAVFGLFVATTARADWWTNVDHHPREIAPGVWSFSVNVPVHPVGELQFVNAQYEFYDFDADEGDSTDGISVDYAYNGAGIDWTNGSTFFVIAPTLFDADDGYIQGWSEWSIMKGKFEGIVYASVPLVHVRFTVGADHLVYGRGRP